MYCQIIRLWPRDSDTYKFNLKLSEADSCLKQGYKVKVVTYITIVEERVLPKWVDLQRRFAQALPDAVIEKQPQLGPLISRHSNLTMILAPKSSVLDGAKLAQETEK